MSGVHNGCGDVFRTFTETKEDLALLDVTANLHSHCFLVITSEAQNASFARSCLHESFVSFCFKFRKKNLLISPRLRGEEMFGVLARVQFRWSWKWCVALFFLLFFSTDELFAPLINGTAGISLCLSPWIMHQKNTNIFSKGALFYILAPEVRFSRCKRHISIHDPIYLGVQRFLVTNVRRRFLCSWCHYFPRPNSLIDENIFLTVCSVFSFPYCMSFAPSEDCRLVKIRFDCMHGRSASNVEESNEVKDACMFDALFRKRHDSAKYLRGRTVCCTCVNTFQSGKVDQI